MNFNVNFTFANDEGKVLVQDAEVSVMDVKDHASAVSKIQAAMTKKFGCTGRLIINTNEELDWDDILAMEDGVTEVTNTTPQKSKPFFEDDNHLSFGSYTSLDFMDSTAFKKKLDSIH